MESLIGGPFSWNNSEDKPICINILLRMTCDLSEKFSVGFEQGNKIFLYYLQGVLIFFDDVLGIGFQNEIVFCEIVTELVVKFE